MKVKSFCLTVCFGLMLIFFIQFMVIVDWQFWVVSCIYININQQHDFSAADDIDLERKSVSVHSQERARERQAVCVRISTVTNWCIPNVKKHSILSIQTKEKCENAIKWQEIRKKKYKSMQNAGNCRVQCFVVVFNLVIVDRRSTTPMNIHWFHSRTVWRNDYGSTPHSEHMEWNSFM